jgi:hypothetical protein
VFQSTLKRLVEESGEEHYLFFLEDWVDGASKHWDKYKDQVHMAGRPRDRLARRRFSQEQQERGSGV